MTVVKLRFNHVPKTTHVSMLTTTPVTRPDHLVGIQGQVHAGNSQSIGRAAASSCCGSVVQAQP